MANVIKITTDNKVQLIYIPVDKNGCLSYEGLYRVFNNVFDIVRIRGEFCFLCDGDGWARYLPYNRTGAFFYNNNPIPGDIIFCFESGPDLYPITNNDFFISLLRIGCPWLSFEELEGCSDG